MFERIKILTQLFAFITFQFYMHHFYVKSTDPRIRTNNEHTCGSKHF